MADKRFYWLKLKQDFFEQDEIKIVENMPNGKDYIIFLLKLQLKSINTEGHLLFKNAIPYSEEMLATLTGTNIDVVRSALKIFMQLQMVERLDNGTLFMAEVQNLIGSEGQSAERVRKFREKQEIALLCNSNVTASNNDVIKSNEHIEKDIEIDKDIYIVQTEQLWNMYPNKKGKAVAVKKIPKLIKEMGYEELQRCVERYSKEVKGTEIQFMKHGSTFFNGGYVDYLDKNYKEIVDIPKVEVINRPNAGAYRIV